MIHQSLHIKQLQKLSPQQIQLVKLLQVSTMELEQRIKQELEENPALEEVNTEADSNPAEEPEVSVENTENSRDTEDFDIRDYLDEDDVADYKLRTYNQAMDDLQQAAPIPELLGFSDYLLSQFRLLSNSETELIIGETLIGNLDENGYLQRELSAIIDDLAFSQNVFTDLETIENVLKKIQALDPTGVGARDLRECLLLQLERKNVTPSIRLAQQILLRMFDAFIRKRYDAISQRFNISETELLQAIQEITQLHPKPGNTYNDSAKTNSQTLIPDFTVIPHENHFEIVLNARNMPELRVNRGYAELLQTYSESRQKTKSQKDAVLFVRQKIDAAKSFIETIKLRQDTLLGTMEAIVNLQPDYFRNGDITELKPMKMQEVSEMVGLDISSISRVVNSKYVQTPFGVFLLRDLFSNAISKDIGEEVTAAEIKTLITEIIAHEDKRHPLNDDALTAILAEKGYVLARRTVAKYRENTGIGVARLRKELKA